MKREKRLILMVGIVMPLLILTSFWYSPDSGVEDTDISNARAEMLVREYSPTWGEENAKVTLVEFMDPACETCKLFHPFVKELLDLHAGKVKLVVRYAPFHKGSDYMVTLLHAAQQQDKFWPVLAVMFEHQAEWASHHKPQPELIWQHLGGLGLDIDRLKQDMQDQSAGMVVVQDLTDAAALGVRKTPDFFVNGKALSKFGYQELRDLVQDEVNKAYSL